MARFRPLSLTVAVICGIVLFTACAPAETTSQTCHRMSVVQEEVAIFEAVPAGDTAQRIATVRGFARELDDIRKSAENGRLAFAAATLADMYWTIAEVAASHPHLDPGRILRWIGSIPPTPPTFRSARCDPRVSRCVIQPGWDLRWRTRVAPPAGRFGWSLPLA